MTALSRVHLLVSGRVQGVGFRFSALDHARRLGLTGWVRNLPDGRVEIVAEGDPERIERFVRWCHEGPPGALVTHVEEERLPASGEFRDFRITY
ncbi:MAG: acylphosphatase [Candidatus Binatia bacterium]|nr:MAG: acylphosphatase [Candidatus Binatia bacterium]